MKIVITEEQFIDIFQYNPKLIVEEIRNLINEAEELELSQETKQNLEDIAKLFGTGYARWIIIKLTDKSIKQEDVYKYKDYFKYFIDGKRLGHFTNTDIFKYKNPQEFNREAIASHEKIIEMSGDITPENQHYFILPQDIQKLANVGIRYLGMTKDGYQCFKIPKELSGNQQAYETYKNILGRCQGRERGVTISFCTIANFDYFNSYLEKDDLYIFFNLKDKFSPYQISYDNQEFEIIPPSEESESDEYTTNIEFNDKNNDTVNLELDYIRNFITFLLEKDNRQIENQTKRYYFMYALSHKEKLSLDIHTRLRSLPELVSDEEKQNLSPSLKIQYKLFSYITPEERNKILTTQIVTPTYRAYYLKLYPKYHTVFPYGEIAPDIAMAFDASNKPTFIDLEGNPANIDKIDPLKLDEEREIKTFIRMNSNNKIKFHDSDNISKFGEYSPSVVLWRPFYRDTKQGMFSSFINKYGEKSVEGIDFRNPKQQHFFFDRNVRAAYFNTLRNDYIFKEVYEFDKYAPNIALAEYDNTTHVFINTKGELSTEGLDPEKLGVSLALTYFRQKTGKPIYTIESLFDGIWIAYFGSEKTYPYMINNKGEISTEGQNPQELHDAGKWDAVTAYFNSIQNEYRYNSVNLKPIGPKLPKGIYEANTLWYSGNEGYIFINDKGKPSIFGLNYNELEKYDKEHPEFRIKFAIIYNNTLEKIQKNKNDK